MTCPICGKYIKDGTGNTHHLYFPKRKFKGTRRGKLTVPLHITCHNQFNYFFMHFCWHKLGKPNHVCTGCRYINVCCYAENWTW